MNHFMKFCFQLIQQYFFHNDENSASSSENNIISAASLPLNDMVIQLTNTIDFIL